MRSGLAIGWLVLAACGERGADPTRCAPACDADQVCRYASCVPPPSACTTSAECAGDQYCESAATECLPWGVGPGGASDGSCAGAPAPGVGFPGVQCAWDGPPAGDAYPAHVNVLATPMVATLTPGAPSIVFPAYNFTDYGNDACAGNDPAHFGVLRVIDGRTCAQLATIAAPTVVATAAVAIGELGGDDATPEIVAARSDGGLVAFTRRASGWQVLWQTTSRFADAQCDWTGASLHDLDDDGKPEVLFYGAVYSGQTGATIDESIAATVDATGIGYLPVVADVDGDGAPELIVGNQLYGWDKPARRWLPGRGLTGMKGMVGFGDFGSYPVAGQDDRGRIDGSAEIVVVYGSEVRVVTAAGRQVFSATLRGGAIAGQAGPPTIADFDGDGRLEIGVAGQSAVHVLDPDCRLAPEVASCVAGSVDGVSWSSPIQGTALSLSGASAFDLEGDGRAELVHGDQCFARVYDGKTGGVVASRGRTSCGWLEYPVMADSDGDGAAELIVTSNANDGLDATTTVRCRSACPALDPVFDGVACVDDTDCAGATRCGRELAGDARGRCRCTQDPQCGEGYACVDPIAGPSRAGRVCRAAHATTASTGVRVLADMADRWATARPIWNQHAYSVTNVDAAGGVPRTSRWLRNWTQPGLNTFRANAAGDGIAAGARADLTVRRATVSCDPGGPSVTAEVCNRGARAVGAGVPVALYTATTPSRLRGQAPTPAPLAPGACTMVTAAWTGAAGEAAVVVDDRGDGTGGARECREDNNALAVRVACP
jgi:hypothetical protein